MNKGKYFAILFLSVFGLSACTNTNTTTKEQQAADEIIRDWVGSDTLPTPECHASTIVKLANGNFLVAWFGGSYESHDDVGIYLSEGKPGAWSAPKEVFKLREDAHWNPVLFQTEDGNIHLYFKVGKEIGTWETWHTVSNNEGKDWSEPVELVEGDRGGRGPVRSKPIYLSDGSILAGASNEDGPWNVFADRSTDGGYTWEASEYLELDREGFKGKGVIQPTLWESEKGHVHMLVRSTNNRVYRADSEDFGKTWGALYDAGLPNPSSAIDLARLDEHTLILLYNPTTRATGNRSYLHAALSVDNGKTWPKYVVVEAEEDAGEGFAYPAVICDDENVYVTYTVKRKNIKFWQASKNYIVEHALTYASEQ